MFGICELGTFVGGVRDVPGTWACRVWVVGLGCGLVFVLGLGRVFVSGPTARIGDGPRRGGSRGKFHTYQSTLLCASSLLSWYWLIPRATVALTAVPASEPAIPSADIATERRAKRRFGPSVRRARGACAVECSRYWPASRLNVSLFSQL